MEKSSKRHLLVDGRGVPLSIVVTGANAPDCKRLDEVLNAIVVKRKNPQHRRSQHLCADAGYRGAAHLRTIQDRGYIPHVVDRRKAADTKRRDSKNKARRWVVEVSHSRSSLKNPLQIPISSSDRCTALKDGHPIARIQARKNAIQRISQRKL
ncbi:IS4 family transposase [Xanthomonas fragariae LMG 25863]|nr:IS4 family transposase [Xanthomonas fragariae LMG 25863]